MESNLPLNQLPYSGEKSLEVIRSKKIREIPKFDQRQLQGISKLSPNQANNAHGQSSASRWTKQEHAEFIKALEKYGEGTSGNEWAVIAAAIGTKTEDEVKCQLRIIYLVVLK
jgi:hypothetical protein